MTVTRSLAEDAITATLRGTRNPTTQYDYAVVINLTGPYDVLIRGSAESAAKEVLSTRRDASWTWSEDGALVIQFTRGDPENAASVSAAFLTTFQDRFETARDQADDPAFDQALTALTN